VRAPAVRGRHGSRGLKTIAHGEPLPFATISRKLRLIVEKALEKEPNDRYQSMREMVVDLRRLQRRPVRAAAAADVTAAPRGGSRLAWQSVLGVRSGYRSRSRLADRTLRPWRRRRCVEVATPSADSVSMAISPDGQRLVFEGLTNGAVVTASFARVVVIPRRSRSGRRWPIHRVLRG
jgi:hypothetical protein